VGCNCGLTPFSQNQPDNALTAGVGARLNQRSEPDGGVERVLLPRCGDEAVGVLLQHQALAHAFLAHPRHGRDVCRVAWVALLDRWSGVAARLALRLCPGERDEAARVPPYASQECNVNSMLGRGRLQNSDWAQQPLDEIDTVTRLRYDRALMPSARVPQAPCPRHAPQGTPCDLTLPLPAARVQPQCSKRGAMQALPLVCGGYCRAVRGARAQPQARRGCWRVPLGAREPISLDIRDASRHDWSISHLSLQTSQCSVISYL